MPRSPLSSLPKCSLCGPETSHHVFMNVPICGCGVSPQKRRCWKPNSQSRDGSATLLRFMAREPFKKEQAASHERSPWVSDLWRKANGLPQTQPRATPWETPHPFPIPP